MMRALIEYYQRSSSAGKQLLFAMSFMFFSMLHPHSSPSASGHSAIRGISAMTKFIADTFGEAIHRLS
jgi:hypothetical protein